MSIADYSVIVHPLVEADYPEYTQISTFSTIAANQLVAYKNELLEAQDLTLGATSNVCLEAVDNVNVYMQDGDFKLYRSSWSNDVRDDTEILTITRDTLTGNTVFTTDGSVIELNPTDPSGTVIIGDFIVSSSNNYTTFTSTQTGGFMFKSAFGAESLLTNGDMVVASNMYVNGHIVGKDLAVWKDAMADSNNELMRVGYAFRINTRNQLELVKYSRFFNDLPDVQKKVATFGMNALDFNGPDEAPEYDTFQDLTSVNFANGKTGTKIFGTEAVPVNGGTLTLPVHDYPNAVVQLDPSGTATLNIALNPNVLSLAEVSTKGTITIIERSTTGRPITYSPGFTFTSVNDGTDTTAAPAPGGYAIDVITYIVLSPTLVSATYKHTIQSP